MRRNNLKFFYKTLFSALFLFLIIQNNIYSQISNTGVIIYPNETFDLYEVEDELGFDIKIYHMYTGRYDRIHNRTFNDNIVRNGLLNFQSRKNYYKEVIYELILQKDFIELDIIETVTASTPMNLNEFNLLNDELEKAYDLGSNLFEFTEKIITATDYAPEYIQRLTTIDNVPISNLEHFSAALSAISIITNTIKIIGTAEEIYISEMLLKSLQADIAIEKINYLRNNSTIDDVAFLNTLDDIEDEFLNIDTSLWTEMTRFYLLNKNQINNALVSGASLTSTIAATIYNSLTETGSPSQNYYMKAYSLHLFNRYRIESFDNMITWILSWTNNTWNELNEINKDFYESFVNKVLTSKINNLKQAIHLKIVPNFSTSLISGVIPLTVNFENRSVGSNLNYFWDFNSDGIIDSNEENPSYTYQEAGNYSVTLTVSDAINSETINKPSFITVTDPNSGGGNSGTGTLDLYSLVPVTVGNSVWLTVYTDPKQEGIPVSFSLNDDSKGTIQLVNGGVTNSSGYANAELTTSSSGTVEISVSSPGFTGDQKNLLVEAGQVGGRFNFVATYQRGNTSYSEYQLHFEDINADWFGESYTVKIDNGYFKNDNSMSLSGTLNDEDDLRLGIIVENNISTLVTLTTLGKEYIFSFIPQILNPQSIVPFISYSGPDLGGGDWNSKNDEFLYTRDETLYLLNANTWTQNSSKSITGRNGIGDLLFNNTGDEFAYIGNDGVQIMNYPSLSSEVSTGDIAMENDGLIEWSENGTRLSVATYQDVHRLYSSSLSNVQELTLTGEVKDIDYNSSIDQYAVALNNVVNEIMIYETIGSWSIIKQLNLDSDDEGASVSFSPDGKYLAAASTNSVKIFDASSNYSTFENLSDNYGRINRLSWNPNSNYNYLAVGNGTQIFIYDMDTKQRVFTATTPGQVWRIKWSNDGKTFSTLDNNGAFLQVYSPFDQQGPEIQINNEENLVSQDNEVLISGFLGEASQFAKLEYQVNQDGWADVELDSDFKFEFNVQGLISGDNTIEFRANDKYLNKEVKSINVSNIQTVLITGEITDTNKDGVEGIGINLTGEINNGVITGDSGIFTFRVPSDKSYSLEFLSDEYAFNNQTISIDSLTSDTLLSIDAKLITYSISGKILGDISKGQNSISIVLESSTDTDTVSVSKLDSTYLFPTLKKGGSYSMYPISSEFGFAPNVYSIDNINKDYELDFSALFIPDTIPPFKPFGIQVNTENGIHISWSEGFDSDIAFYRIYKDTVPNPEIVFDTLNVSNRLFKDFDFLEGQDYYYSISALDKAGNESSKTNLQKILVPLQQPTDNHFAIPNIIFEANDSISTICKNYFGSGFEIADWLNIKSSYSSSDNFLKELGLFRDGQLLFVKNGGKEFKEIQEGPVLPGSPMQGPSEPLFGVVENNLIESGDRYFIQTHIDGNAPNSIIDQIGTDVVYLGAESTVTGHVLCYSQTGVTLPPSMPVIESIAQLGDTVKLTWKNLDSDLMSYNIYRGESEFGISLLDTLSAQSTFYVDRTIENGKSYYYQIQAKDSTGLLSDRSEIHHIEIVQNSIFNVSIGNYQGNIGDTLRVPILLNSDLPNNYEAFQFFLLFDPQILELVDISTMNTISDNFDIQINSQIDGEIKLSGASSKVKADTGIFMNLFFSLNQEGNSDLEWVNFYLNEGDPEVIFSNGRVSSSPILRQCGDVTNDGNVTNMDATYVLRHVVKLSPQYPLVNEDSLIADVTGNGWITAYDGAQILRSIIGKSHLFNCYQQLSKILYKPLNVSYSWDVNIVNEEKSTISVPLKVSSVDGEIESIDLMISIPEGLSYDGFQDIPDNWIKSENFNGENLYISMVGSAGIEDDLVGNLKFKIVDQTKNLSITSEIRVNENQFEQLSELVLFELPKEFKLEQNFPNPFNPTTNIKYSIPEQSDVRLIIYNVLGQEVALLVNENKMPGIYSVRWDASNNASGLYIYQLISGNTIITNRMMLIK